MTLAEHLYELRNRVAISAVSIVVGTAIAYVFHNADPVVPSPTPILRTAQSLPPRRRQVHACFSRACWTPFTVTLKVFALCRRDRLVTDLAVSALEGSSPRVLYSHEKRYAIGFVTASVALFAMGAAFAYLTVGQGPALPARIRDRRRRLTAELQQLPVVCRRDGPGVRGCRSSYPCLSSCSTWSVSCPPRACASGPGACCSGFSVFAAVATPSQDPFTMRRARDPHVSALRRSCGHCVRPRSSRGAARLLDVPRPR